MLEEIEEIMDEEDAALYLTEAEKAEINKLILGPINNLGTWRTGTITLIGIDDSTVLNASFLSLNDALRTKKECKLNHPNKISDRFLKGIGRTFAKSGYHDIEYSFNKGTREHKMIIRGF